ncbi:MAG TPA: putative lipopolysaccharide heptosyltransferase III [Burkholderiales bacterium]
MPYGPADAIDPGALSRALVIKLRHHGDVLLASPVFSVLKNLAPRIEIDALVYADTRDMLSLHPAIAEIHVIDRAWKRSGALAQARAELALFSRLRARRYDLVVHLSEHPRGAWLARALGARWAVAPDYADKPRYWKRSFTHRYALPKGARRHMVELNLDALRRLGIRPGDDERRLVLVPGEAAERRVDALLAQAGLAAKGFVHFHPGSRWQFKCWPADRAAALLDELERRGHRVVLTAAPDPAERELVDDMLSRTRVKPLDLSGQLTLKELAALAGRARLFVGVDSAPMHIAAAMQTPVVALFGPSGELEWGPWQVAHRVVASTVHPCRPCGNDGCGGGKVSECLTHLPLASVLGAVDALLR